jgi:isopenicillin N synthase-like dioxygenase
MHLLLHTRFLNHADIGSITILWSQPIGGLQILAPDGKWKWVRHIDNGLVRP